MLSLLRCGRHAMPGWPGELEVRLVAERGLPPVCLAHVLARPRAGGERFQSHEGGPARALKKQFQAAGVPAEGRQGPLLFDPAGRLLWVPGLGVDAHARAPAGAPQWDLQWHAAPDAKARLV
ncbi:MAG TPA: tRNA lysidine(34) synthetase TilS [Burkholderiaceae bacterium]